MAGQRWAFDLRYSLLRKDEMHALLGFCMAQDGQFDTFQFVSPNFAPRGAASGAPLVNGAGQTGPTIVTDGWTPSIAGICKAGDVIKCAGHSKIYMLTADAASNSLGQATLSIMPALMAVPADNEAITVTNVPFTVALATDVTEATVQTGMQYGFDVRLVESY